MTGVTSRTPADRTLHLAGQLIGNVDRVGSLGPTGDPAVAGHRDGVRAAAEELGLTLVEGGFASPEDVPDAVTEFVDAGVDVVYLASANATVRSIEALETELLAARLPVVANVEYVDVALLTLPPTAPSCAGSWHGRQSGSPAGAEVASVPVEDPPRGTMARRTSSPLERARCRLDVHGEAADWNVARAVGNTALGVRSSSTLRSPSPAPPRAAHRRRIP